jgi:ACS family glucarate transporter-like MFS transporter
MFLAFWLFIISGVAYLDRTNISIAGLAVGRQYGFGNQQLQWIFFAFLIGYVVFQLPAAILAVRFGPRRVLAFGVLWWGIATALTALVPSTISHALLLLIGIRFLLGVGEAVIDPAATQFVANWVPQEERGFVNGLILAGVGAGSGLTPPLLTWLIVEHGWRSAFWLSAAVASAAGAVWWVFARDTPEEHPGVSRAELKEIRLGLGSVTSSQRSPRRVREREVIAWRALLRRRDLAALMIGYFSFGYIAWVFFSWFFLNMAQVRGSDLRESAQFSTLPSLCMTVCSLVGGLLSDRLTRTHGLRAGRCYLASASLMVTAVFLVVGSQVRSPALAGVILAWGAGALYLSQSTFWSASIDIAGGSAGVFCSFVNMGGLLGGAVTASLTPWIAQRHGWNASFAVGAGMAVLGALCWLVVHPERALGAADSDVGAKLGLAQKEQNVMP